MVTQDGSINRILNRNECLMAKAPQSFRLDDILSVHDRAKDDGIHDFIDFCIDDDALWLHFIPCTRGN